MTRKSTKANAATQNPPAATRKRDAAKTPPLTDDREVPVRRLVVHGTVFHPDGSPATGLTVVAFDDDRGDEDYLGDAVTHRKGRFSIDYSKAFFGRVPNERHDADLFLRVCTVDGDVLFQSETVRGAPTELQLDVHLPHAEFVVRGQVRHADGTPAPGITVQVYDVDVRLTEPLGKPVITDGDGRFSRAYATSDFARAEKGSADLRVTVRHDDGRSASSDILFNAPADAMIDLVLPWSPEKRSEFELLVETLLPLLKGQAGQGQALAIEALETEDVDFLAADTGIERRRIGWLVRASRLAHDNTIRLAELAAGKPVRLSAESSASALPAEVYYAFFRMGVDPAKLWSTPVDTLIAAVSAAVEQGIIPAAFGDLDDITRRLEQITRDRALDAPATGTRVKLGELFATLPTPLEPAQLSLIAPALATLRPTDPQLVERVAEIAGFDGDPVPVARTLWLGALTGGHLPLMAALQTLAAAGNGAAGNGAARDGAGVGRVAPRAGALVHDLRAVAALDLDGWMETLKRPQANGQPIGVPLETPGASADERLLIYATTLLSFVEIAMPTAVIAGRIARETGDDSPFVDVQTDLETFFTNNPAFELGTTPIALYLKEGREGKLANVSDPARLTAQVVKLTRLARLTPHYPQMRALLVNDLHSALGIVHVGERRFIRTFAAPLGGAAGALAVFRKAEQVHATALNVYMKYGAQFNSPLPYVISGGPAVVTPAAGVALSPIGSHVVGPQAPDPSAIYGSSQYAVVAAEWATMFGALDLCDCDDCKSLYSPAAYYVDVLKFLDGPEGSPLEALMRRRPDLEHIELTCENSTRPLPYIDLTNEILEAAVIPRTFVIPNGADLQLRLADLDAARVPETFPAAFAAAGYPLTGEASVRPDASVGTTTGLGWMILDRGWAFEIKRDAKKTGFNVTPWPQTSWATEELKANPEHVHDAAYAILGDAVYPWTLPFNLPVEEARVHLQHLGVPRREVMETFFAGDASNASSDREVVHEYLGLTSTDAEIITGVRTHDAEPVVAGAATNRPWDFWGLTETGNDTAYPDEGSAWNEVLTQVPVFLRQSGLAYVELLELLGTYFINPPNSDGRPLHLVAIGEDVHHTPVNPATCDLDKLRIESFDVPATLDRIHRFVRLQRQLGWTMRELDQAIDALTPDYPAPTLDEPLLAALSHVQRLRAELNVPLVDMLSWWSDIATAGYVDQLADHQPAVPTLYEQLFRNKSVINPVDPAFTEDAQSLSGTLGDHLPALVAALGISAADLSRLMTGTPAAVTTDDLDLANLSRLSRAASLARALKLSIQEYQTIRRVSGLDPFPMPAISAPATTMQFVEHVAAIRASGFGIEELAYVLRHEPTPSSGIAPTEADLAAILYDVRSALQSNAAENTFREDPADPEGRTTDPRGELTRRKLALLNWDTAVISDLVATLNGAVVYEAFTDAFATAPVLPNDSGADKVSLASRPADLTLPVELNGVASVVPTFLFAVDAAIPVESAAGGTISVELDQKFSDHLITLPANAAVVVETTDTAWTIDGRYSIVRNGSIASVSDQEALELRASRVLSTPERVLLGASSTDADFANAAARLFSAQDELQGSVAYNEVRAGAQPKGRLRFTGSMTNARKTRLDLVSADPSYRAAVQELYDAPRAFVARYARTLSPPDVATDLTTLPDIAFPTGLASRIYFDAATIPGQLHFVGVMTDQQRETLRALSADTSYQDAVDRLYHLGDPSNAPVPDASDVFLSAPVPVTAVDPASDTALLFDGPTNPEARFLMVLRKLLPHLRRTLGERLIVQKVSDALRLETRTASDLLTRWVSSPTDPTRRIVTDFQASSFAGGSVNAPPTAAAYPEQFAALALLHKIGLVVNELDLTSTQLAWLFENASAGGWLDLNALPVVALAATASSAASFIAHARLVDLVRLRSTLPFGEMRLFDLFDVARATVTATLNSVRNAAKTAYLAALEQRTSWTLEDLEVLLGPGAEHREKGVLGFAFPDDYMDERMLLQVRECFKRMKRIGASAAELSAWGKSGQTAAEERENAVSIKNAAKGKYTDRQWLALAKALRDPLREKQRSALVSYLVSRPNGMTGQPWRDVAELYEHYLADVEMGACMTSTRILQATNSIQLFIQRGLMNLEAGVRLTPVDAQQWTQWRRQYRLWEANRQVLFYPENWIEPELRDDKSPFFLELEDELLQNDLTVDRAEDAFLHYLEKVEHVAHLEIVGMYREEEPVNGHGPVDILHVFGRTNDIPHRHFYRRLQGGVWTPWESVDLDIEGDHLLPVVWNRRLHLIWPIFTEKSDPATKAQRDANEDPTKYWEIQFARSEYRHSGWSPKRLSKDTLRQDQHLHPAAPTSPQNEEQKPRDMSFKTRVDGDRLLIECYGGRVAGERTTRDVTTPPPEFPLRTDVLGAVAANRDLLGVHPTAIRIRFTVDGAKPTREERGRIALVIRGSNSVPETVALNSQGGADSRGTYTDPVMLLDVQSKGFTLAGLQDVGSWWMPFNPVGFIESVIETISDAIADAAENDPVGAANAARDLRTATDGAIAAIVASGGAALPIVLGVLSAAVGAAFTGAVALGFSRPWGRKLIVNLRPIPVPPATITTEVTDTTVLTRMHGIGLFALDDCHGTIKKLEVLDLGSLPVLGALPRARIENMMFVEDSSPGLMMIGTQRIGVPPAWIPSDPMSVDVQLLNVTPGTFRLLAPHQDPQFTAVSPFFFQDDHRSYLVSRPQQWVFAIHYHPSICALITTLKREGIGGLLRLPALPLTDTGSTFLSVYFPNPVFVPPNLAPKEGVDFSREGAYALYNWELFFHIPFLIATQLTRNQRFAEAQKWFHYVFDPTATDSPEQPSAPGTERFWRVEPLHEEALRPIQTLDALIADAGAIDAQITEWQANPFKPHAIARMRKVAYMKAVVMHYIDNLIAWGDQLFRQDTIETINEATQLYVLAGEILGRRPADIPARARPKVQTFRTLDDKSALNSLSNAVVEIENFLPPSAAPASPYGTQGGSLLMPFFSITANDKLLGYWDTVADRLFKIRHCMNIDGVERALPLFQPRLDPGLLVRAAAAGVDIASVLADLNAAVPHYRFNVMLQKATELCNDVKSLGAALLSALEKKDGEELALLRSTHEVELLKAIRETKKQQIQEANDTLAGLLKYQDVVTARQQYYQSRAFMNAQEAGHLDLVGASLIPMGAQVGAEVLAAILHLIPDAKLGFFTTVGATYGGNNIASAIQASGSAAGTIASILNTSGSLSATVGGYQRRQDDWTHQGDLATKELQQVLKQIAAAEIRLAIAEHELENHDLQIENARDVDDFMRHRKFTNQELYSWMVGKLSGIYFQGYQLAYDVAKRAERTFRHELGLQDSNFIQFGYWDSLKKGLLSGERLHHDLKRMDVAYLDQNKREYEITKHISLNAIDPISLINLKETGECVVTLPEALFDLDYPGHYMRRLKTVSLTIPCVTGPYAGVNCTLTQLTSSIRHASTLSGSRYARKDEDARFSDAFGVIQSIVTSGAQNDSGLFETNMRDERYLPFEGQGAIGTWRIQLPTQFKSFDYDTIADVVLHLRYTARDGGEPLRQHAAAELSAALQTFAQSEGEQGLARAFSLRHEFPTEWYRFLNPPTANTGDQTLTLGLTRERFPFLFQDRISGIDSMELFVKVKPGFADSYNDSTLKLSLAAGRAASSAALPVAESTGLLRAVKSPAGPPGDWTLTAWVDGTPHMRLDPEAIQDILLVSRYECA